MVLSLPQRFDSSAKLPDTVHGYVSVTSAGGTSCLALKSLPKSAEAFRGKPSEFRNALNAVTAAGLRIDAASRLGFAVSGPPTAFEKLTAGRVKAVEVLMHADSGVRRYVTHLDIVGKNQPPHLGVGLPSSSASGLEAVILERPRQPTAAVFPSPLPPSPAGYYLRAPDDVAIGLGAAAAHAAGYRGTGVLIAMVDTGQYAHPFFLARGYSVKKPVVMVQDTSPDKDPVGHGTGESANIFACAPEAVLQAIRASDDDGNLVKTIGGFLAAKNGNPRIISCSWGGDREIGSPLTDDDKAWALEIQDAVDQGIFVVFSAGNGHFSIEPQVPGVFAAGGTYLGEDHSLRASNYASGYVSPYYTNRTVPDACGLVGLLPRADYIMLPVPPGCSLDKEMSEVDQQNNPGDGTAPADGWARFSGTSAAAPQIAGIAALIISAKPDITPAEIKQAITSTATDVVAGRCHPRFDNPAGPGPDAATGAGLANAIAAVQSVLGD